MKEQTVIDLFKYYFGFWIIELKLNDKYKFELRKDNRINAYADVGVEDKYTYLVRFNTKKFKYKFQIPHVVLHELGHIMDDFRKGDDGESEFVAEYFALSKSKIYYPKMYARMVQWTKKALLKDDDEVGEEHKHGYKKALEKLGEL